MTNDQTSRNTLRQKNLVSAGTPIHQTLVPYCIACFTGALVTDVVYWQTVAVMWERFSIWLITAGLIIAGLATSHTAIDFCGPQTHSDLTWPRAVGYAIALVRAHQRFRSQPRRLYRVGPTGLILSGLVV